MEGQSNFKQFVDIGDELNKQGIPLVNQNKAKFEAYGESSRRQRKKKKEKYSTEYDPKSRYPFPPFP